MVTNLQYVAYELYVNDELDINATLYHFRTVVRHHHNVKTTDFQQVVFFLCEPHHGAFNSQLPVASIKGTISFRNPYGFIPAELYGMLPFEVCFPVY
jgi:hypothetical protein